MTPADVERVFGTSRLQMVTGGHVEVVREQARSGEERRYTKRFLQTAEVDFRPWTEREWRILVRLARLPGAPVARALDFVTADDTGTPRLQTRDAGATLDQWATQVPLRRGERPLRSVFEDCANWWALTRQLMIALDALHALGFVHLDLKPDNVCIPWAPAGAGRPVAGQPLAPRIKALTLIDVAFSLVPEVELTAPLPLLKQPAYEYQSPRLLHALEDRRRGSLAATRSLDWRCDFFSLAAMLWRYLPEIDAAAAAGWSVERHQQAREFVQQLLDLHAAPLPAQWPHRQLIALAAMRLREPDLQAALQAGCTFDPDRQIPLDVEPTPPTRVADTAPRQAEHEGAPIVSAPAPLDAQGRREPSVSAPSPFDALRREPGVSAPSPLDAVRREPSVSAPSPLDALARQRGDSAATPLDRSRREPSASAPMASGDTAAASAPLPPDTAPIPWPDTAAEDAPTEASPIIVPIRRRRDRRRTMAAVTVGVAVAAAAAAWWASGRGWPFATVPPIALPTAEDNADSATLAAAVPASSAAVVVPSPPPAVKTVPVPSAAHPLADAASSPPAPSAAAPVVEGATVAEAPSPVASTATAMAGPDGAAPEGATSAPSAALSAGSAPPSASAPAPLNPEREPAAADDNLDAAAVELLRDRIPRLAQSAERQVGRVLAVAANAGEFHRRSDVRNAAQSMRAAAPRPAFPVTVREGEARRLNEAARIAYWQDNDLGRALHLQTRAFAANPLDSEIVGNLAFLRLKQQPPDAEAARQLALHSLTLHDPRFPSGRIEDWTAFAIASALTGRDVDARNAWFASMALASDLQHQCNNAVRSEALYGDRLRPSVQAMLQRARSSAAYGRCEAVLAPRAGRAKSKPSAARRPAQRGKANPPYRRGRLLGQ